ncbi:MAG: alpha/beta fold hydrolase [Pseudomonadota bacterium]|nr:alpha/beta fold hydrolase [Pseudomonadota bacterium]
MSTRKHDAVPGTTDKPRVAVAQPISKRGSVRQPAGRRVSARRTAGQRVPLPPLSDVDPAVPKAPEAPNEIAAGATEGILGPNPFVGLRASDLLASARDIAGQVARSPLLLMKQQAALARDLISVLTGSSDLAPAPADKRFLDAAWKSNRFYRQLLQGHLAWVRALDGLVVGSKLQDDSKERARFAVSLLTDALAPTNSLLGNPGALKKLLDSGGASIVKGVQNMLHDLHTNHGMPSQVDTSAFEIGKNVAVTPGAVVFRNEVLELLQYRPTTATVHARPHLLVPPQVNKFYIFDISSGKSIIEFLVKSGFQVFAVSWRNPTPAQRDWDMDTYVDALLEAIGAVRAITGAADVNLHGACSGAMTMAALLGYLKGTKKPLVNAATLMVAVLDNRADSQLGTFVTPATVAAAKRNSAAKGVLEGQEMGRIFAWMRPNDLVWNYWVNNYLMGNPPPVFDILYWNNDSTRLAARFHSQLLDIFTDNLLVKPGAMTVLGKPIDLSKVDCDKYLVAGITDHITPWRGVFNSARAFGGSNEFVVSSSGHIQSLVNPPGNPKSKFLINRQANGNADEWLAGATATADTWWNHWSEWLAKRSGPQQAAAPELGNARYPPREPAPGTYVRER